MSHGLLSDIRHRALAGVSPRHVELPLLRKGSTRRLDASSRRGRELLLAEPRALGEATVGPPLPDGVAARRARGLNRRREQLHDRFAYLMSLESTTVAWRRRLSS
jgi:hypothetical protein